jgi:hypothetical protein
MAAGVDMGLISGLMMILAGLGSNMFGFPPGDRDPGYERAAPAESMLYFEWAASSAGIAGDTGVDGLAADPEIRQFVDQFKSAVFETIERETANAGPREQAIVGRHLPPLIEHLIGHSGCLYFTFSPLEPGDSGDERGPPAGGDWLALVGGAQLTLIFDGGDAADENEQRLIELLNLLPVNEAPGEELDRFTIPLPLPAMRVIVHREGSHFIFTLGTDESGLDRAIAGLKGEVEGLGQSELFQRQFEHVKLERVGSLGMINIARIRETAIELTGPFGGIAKSMLHTVGADRVDSLITVSGVADGQLAGRTYLHTGGSTRGVFTLAAGRGLTPAEFADIPGDADFVAAATLDFPLVLRAIEQVIQSVDPSLMDGADAMKQQFAQQAGFDLERDFLAAYGQRWTVFNSPAAGGLFTTSLTFALEVVDHEKAQLVHGKFVPLLRSALPGDFSNEFRKRSVSLESREFLGHTIHFVNTIGDDVPVAPAFCLTERQLLFALHPQAIKAHLRFLDEQGTSFEERFSRQVPEQGAVIGYSMLDARQLIELVYTVVPYVMQPKLSEGQSGGFDLDIFAIPSARAVLPYLRDSQGWIVRKEEGLLFESRSSLPVPGAGLLIGFFWATRAHSGPPIPQAIEAVPADF